MLEFLQSEQNPLHALWVIVLVSSTDGVTGLTGQTGQAYFSKNGATPFLSTNSLVEIDSVHMPGQYSLQLTSGELDTLGFLSLTMKTANSLAFHDRAIITYNNPYQSAGGFSFVPNSAGASTDGGLKKSQALSLVKEIRQVIKEELSAIEKDEPIEDDDSELMDKLDAILAKVSEEKEENEIDFSPVIDHLSGLPKPIDYSKNFNEIISKFVSLDTTHKKETDTLSKLIKSFQEKVAIANKRINTTLEQVEKIDKGFKDIEAEMAKFRDTFAEQTDMDKRFATINGKLKDQTLADIQKQMIELHKAIIETKYDILKKVVEKSRLTHK